MALRFRFRFRFRFRAAVDTALAISVAAVAVAAVALTLSVAVAECGRKECHCRWQRWCFGCRHGKGAAAATAAVVTAAAAISAVCRLVQFGQVLRNDGDDGGEQHIVEPKGSKNEDENESARTAKARHFLGQIVRCRLRKAAMREFRFFI